MVPNKARHKQNAERLIDYYYQPEVGGAARGVHQLHLPRRGCASELAKIDKEAADNPLILPDAEMVARGHSFRP